MIIGVGSVVADPDIADAGHSLRFPGHIERQIYAFIDAFNELGSGALPHSIRCGDDSIVSGGGGAGNCGAGGDGYTTLTFSE